MGRFIRMVLVAVIFSAALVMLITYRNNNVGQMPPVKVQALYKAYQVQNSTLGQLGDTLLGKAPPLWIQRLSITWNMADPGKYWWVPLLFIGGQFLAVRMTRRRMRR